MAGEFKQCPNGHYYQGDHCPYCTTTGGGTKPGNTTAACTEIFADWGGGASYEPPTELNSGSGGNKTTVVDGQTRVAQPSKSPSNRTVFGDEEEVVTASGERVVVTTRRTTRRLVGWLVSYSADPMGVDNRLYEGQNTIGRDVNNNITVGDNMMSSKHALLLFREGQYALKDEMSAHGTFVNGENIGFETRLLKDGDVIRMGQTTFKFRSSF